MFLYTRATCSAFGSAQQYQGSLRYGTVARARAGREPWRAMPARWWAIAVTVSNTARRAAGGTEPWEMQTECLVEPGDPGDPSNRGAAPRVDLKIRCLQLQDRAVEEASGEGFRPVEFLDVDGELAIGWDEGVERELTVDGIAPSDLAQDGERVIPFELSGGVEVEELRSAAGELAGRLVRRRWPILGEVRLSAERVSGGERAPELLRLR